jgi:hypothetical protein
MINNEHPGPRRNIRTDASLSVSPFPGRPLCIAFGAVLLPARQHPAFIGNREGRGTRPRDRDNVAAENRFGLKRGEMVSPQGLEPWTY